VGEWKSLPNTLKSPSLAGHRKFDIGGNTVDCELVRGKSEAKPPLSGELKRELCVDTSRNLIVWEEEKFSSVRRTYTYTKIDRDIDIPADVFVPTAPPGSRSTPYELPVAVRLGFKLIGNDPGLSVPRILSKREPVYDSSLGEGKVILYVIIDAQGLPQEIDVYKHLNPGLDASAIQAVRTWRFTAATRNNRPIAVGSLIQINFKRI
jgi:TonB family protein